MIFQLGMVAYSLYIPRMWNDRTRKRRSQEHHQLQRESQARLGYERLLGTNFDKYTTYQDRKWGLEK